MAPRRPLLLLLSAIALLAVSAVLIPTSAQADAPDYTVDTTADLAFDGTTSVGTYCKDLVADDCSLRQAIGEANRDGQASTISFLPTAFSPGTITVGNPGLVISASNLTIDARPAFLSENLNVRLDGNGADFPGLKVTASNVSIYGLSITGFSGQFTSEGAGIQYDGAGATNNLFSDGYLGVLRPGNSVNGNRYGVLITNGASQNAVRRTIIGGNTFVGVWIENSNSNTVATSSIGIGAGNQDFGNDQAGVVIVSKGNGTSSGNVIGGLLLGDTNTISGNGPPNPPIPRAGILITGAGSTGNIIRANRIGLNLTGATPIANSGDGIRIENGAKNTTIIGTASAPLVISGNSRYGIAVTGSGTYSNTIGTNVFVGTDNNITTSVGNGAGGIFVDDGATVTNINGSIIAGNAGGPGVLVNGTSTAGTTVSNSSIGRFTSNGTLRTLPNKVGVQIAGAGSTSVLTTTLGNNTEQGILSRSTGPVTVTANTVVANGGDGVLLDGPRNVLLRTNTITANLQSGLVLSGTQTASVTSNTIRGQSQAGLVLRGAASTTMLSNTVLLNTGGGVLLETGGVSKTLSSSLTGNTVSGNGQYGIRLSEALTTTLLRNYIGLSTARTTTVPNTGNGLEIFDAVNTSATDTFVAGNTGAGIVVSGAGTANTTISNATVGLMVGTVGYTAAAANGQEGLRITNGATATLVSGGVFAGAGAADTSPAGILISTSAVTVSGAVVGGVKESSGIVPPTLPRPFGPGIEVTGPVSGVNLLDNTLRYNKGPGIKVSGNAQRVRMLGNRLADNASGVNLVGTTLLPVGGPGSLSNPNHDIDPPVVDVDTFSNPLRLQVDDQGIISGFVITSTAQAENALSPPSACNGCSIQLFAPNEGSADSQGWTLLTTRNPDNVFSQEETSFLTNGDGSYRRQLVNGVGAAGQRLLLVATDSFGNSSTYGVFPVSAGFTLTNLTGNKTAIPGQTVTYTLRVSNTGTLNVTNLRLEATNNHDQWGIATQPTGGEIFSKLLAGTTRLITVSLTLPKGPNDQVSAGVKDVTTVRVIKDDDPTISQSLQIETTVLPAPVLVVTPSESVGKARPNETVPHTHVLRNDGNVPVTISFTSTTLDRTGAVNPDWVTTITPPSLDLAPGQERPVQVEVLVPNGAQVRDDQGNLIQATTYVTATIPVSPTGGFGPLSTTFTDTTRVDLDPDAVLTDSDQEESGAAGQPVVFSHSVRNDSNAPTRFCFIWSTSLGSTVTFQSRTNGFAIDANGCFSLDTTTNVDQNRFQQAFFDAVVLVNDRLLPGDRETINISLRNVETGETIGSARLVNRVNVLLGLLRPRVYLPLTRS